MIYRPSKKEIRQLAVDFGFDYAAISSAFPSAREAQALEEWCDAGRHGDMRYMQRTLDLRRVPQKLMPEIQSILSLGVSYYSNEPVLIPQPPNVSGRVARYAWGLDYHEVIQERLKNLCLKMNSLFGDDLLAQTATDAQPLLERSFAYQAGLGFYGKNTNIIFPGAGSWLFLAEVLLNIELEPDGPPVKQGCGSCKECINQCPTGALPGDYTLDARKCISYLTIENKGVIPREMRSAIGPWVFGCDVCQECCPFNARQKQARWPEFSSRFGVGPWLDLRQTLGIRTSNEFKARFQRTPLMRAKRSGLLRNACVTAGNLQTEELIKPLAEVLSDDSEPLIRLHGAWALGRWKSPDCINILKKAWEKELDVEVRHEIEFSLENAA